MKELTLGVKARDKVTGVEGIVVSRHEYLNGCVRYSIQPKPPKKDGTMPAEVWFDEKQLEVVGAGVKVEARKTGGPTTSSPPKGLRA